MANKSVPLSKPIVGHEATSTLEFREPHFNDIMEIGDAYVWTPRGDGYEVPSPIYENIKAYAERLLVKGDKPGNPLLLGMLGVEDTLKVRDAIKDFFLDLDPRVSASRSSPTNSSSGSAGDQTSSAD